MSASTKVDMAALTIANCRFISPPDADFLIITTQEALGHWNAQVARTVGEYRSLLLSATGNTPEAAVYELHAKSADAARSHLNSNGFALVPGPGVKSGSSKASNGRDAGLSDSSLTADVLDNDLSMSSGCESLSDDETVSIASGVADRKAKHKGEKEHKRKEGGKGVSARLSRSRSRSSIRSGSRSRSHSRSSSVTSELDTPRAWVRPNPPFNSMRHGVCVNPPPPVSSGSGFDTWPQHMSGMPRILNRPPAPSPSTQGMMGGPPNPQSLHIHDVLIRVHWIGRGYAQVMRRLVVNQPTLQSAALAYVRRNPGAFSGAQPSDHQGLKMPMGSPGSLCLFASLRSVFVAGDQVDLRNYQGDNLSTLIQEAQDARTRLPKFEIDISSAPPAPFPHGGMGAGRPVSTGPVVSDC
ncbi:hypothetical protein BR93DRAFT_935705 [Coniochaeta sp. PMI_546]|nr:hypothetical protein BR93DRAFT_935705 [Coniochaeta sp. PMI_546]